MKFPEKYSTTLKKATDEIPGIASESHCNLPGFISNPSKTVAVQETLNNNNGRNVTLSVMIGPYTAPRDPLALNEKNCIIGIHAAITGSNCCGFLIGKFLLINRLLDQPKK